VRPDLFPLAMLTELECNLWGMYFEQRKKKIVWLAPLALLLVTKVWYDGALTSLV